MKKTRINPRDSKRRSALGFIADGADSGFRAVARRIGGVADHVGKGTVRRVVTKTDTSPKTEGAALPEESRVVLTPSPDTPQAAVQTAADRLRDKVPILEREAAAAKAVEAPPKEKAAEAALLAYLDRAQKAQEVESRQSSKPSAEDKPPAHPERAQVTEKKLPAKPVAARPKVLSIDALMERYPVEDPVIRTRIRNAMDDLIHGYSIAREEGRSALRELGAAAEPYYIELLSLQKSGVTEVALEELHRLGSVQLDRCLREAIASPDQHIRFAALRVAQRLDEERALPFLQMGLSDKSVDIRRAAITFLSWSQSAFASSALIDHCRDSDPEVQWTALEALLVLQPEIGREMLDLVKDSLSWLEKQRAAKLVQWCDAKKSELSNLADLALKTQNAPPKNPAQPEPSRSKNMHFIIEATILDAKKVNEPLEDMENVT